MAHQIRTIRMDDAAEVGALLDWAWFPARSEAGWRWLCRTPRSREARAVPVGWVAEDEDGRIGGVFGLFAQDYVVDGGAALGATGHSLVVHPRLHGAAHTLLDAAAACEGLFGLSIFDGNARSQATYERHGFTPWPVERGDLRLVWVTDPLAVLAERAAHAALDRRGAGAVRPSVERFLRPRVFQTGLVRLGDRIRQVMAGSIDARFDTFWTALAAEGRLTARRDAASLRWRMADPDRTLDPFLLTWGDGDEIGGYLLAQIGKTSEIDFPTLEIIDLVALEGVADQAMPELVSALVRNAARLGVARVRLSVVDAEMEERMSRVPGAIRRRSHVHGKVLFAPGGRELAASWRLTPYDGDYGFCLRSPPRPERMIRAA